MKSKVFEQIIEAMKRGLDYIKEDRSAGKISYLEAERRMEIQKVKIQSFTNGYNFRIQETIPQTKLERFFQ